MNHNPPHRRLNPLTSEWVLVSPHRTQRPWLGKTESIPGAGLPTYDPACYLCPGNARAGGVRNPNYDSTFVFDNDFAALLPLDSQQVSVNSEHSPLLAAEPVSGHCRVVCFSPRHDLTLPELSLAEVEAVVAAWTRETQALSAREHVQYVQVFENKGEIMGCSNPHPHSQIWASSLVPNESAKELEAQRAYLQKHGTCLLCDYVRLESEIGERLVAVNEHFTALVPHWAIWPFEIMIVANDHTAALPDLDPAQRRSLADILKRVATRYDNLFEVSFPYSMGFHQAPTDGRPHPEWHLHAHFYPPLLRSAAVKKFMVGYEMLAMPQRDLTPEVAAERLRGLSDERFNTTPRT